jgi:5-methyltetrahydropteroyltriglutamate--homocysteine methyltransferase
MRRSTDRILTTHTGSLPRPAELVATMAAGQRGEASGPTAILKQVDAAVDAVVRAQVSAGIDLVNDGEQSKPDYSTYIKDRLTGFSGEVEVHPVSRDARDFPEFFASAGSARINLSARPSCTGPIAWKDFAAVRRDIARFAAALARHGKAPADAFMTAVSPGQAARFLGNQYYASHEEYLVALAAALKDEYDAIAQAGFTLQVDCPDLASGWNNQFSNVSLEEFRKIVRLHLEVLDHATRDVPTGQLRLHLCWGNYAGPHNHDIPLAHILDLVLASRASAISFEAANPRHEHEWHTFQEIKLPDDKVIIPGVLDSLSNFVDHPQAVADRIVRFAKVVGRDRVIAGTDCGFATFASSATVHPTIAWAKLSAMVQGAAFASKELWN